jgi:hypothetical protein
MLQLFAKKQAPERRRKDLHILVKCGIGDVIAYLARLDSLLAKYDNPRVYFHVGSYGEIPELIAEVMQPDRRIYGCNILYGYVQGSERRQKQQLKRIRRNAFPGDIILNWVPDDSETDLKMTHPFSPELFPDDHAAADEFLLKNDLKAGEALGIHPITTRGNAGAFDEKRYWPQEKWHALVKHLLDRGERLVLFGAHGEEYGLKADGKQIFSAQGIPVRHTIALLLKVKGLIGTNSWCWEIVGYSGKPIISFFFTFPENIHMYVPEKKDHLKFFTEKSTSVAEAIQAYEAFFIDKG